MAVPGKTLRQVIHNLDALYPGFKQGVLHHEGRIQPGLSVAIDGETHHLGLLEPVQEESEVHFIPSLGGG